MTHCCHISMTYEREVIMDAGTEIPIDDISSIDGNKFNETESM